MDEWADFYERLFNFREVRYFDIEGQVTGVKSQGDDQPLRQDPHPDQRGRQREGRARSRSTSTCTTAKASSTSRSARPTSAPPSTRCARSGVKLLDTVDTYYELIDKRIPGHGEDVAELKQAQDPGRRQGRRRCCCRSSRENQLGPIFFEFIQRKGDEGFGEGNFKALFESHRARPDAPRRAEVVLAPKTPAPPGG